MVVPSLVDQLHAYLSTRPVPPGSIDELVTDVRDFVRMTARSQERDGAPSRSEPDPQPRLPAVLTERAARWEASRLRTLETYVEQARLSLGFGHAPLPDDADLAKEIWYWLTTPNPHHYVTSPSSPAARLGEAVKLLLPRSWPALPGQSDRESQWMANRVALRNFEFNTNLIADFAGVNGQAIAVWILTSIRPHLECIKVSKGAKFNGPTSIVMQINPDVVKPEEINALYRQMRRLRSSSDDRLREFALEDGLPIREWNEDRLARWNDRYPLAQFNNVNSARVAAARADRNRKPLSAEQRTIQTRVRVVDKRPNRARGRRHHQNR